MDVYLHLRYVKDTTNALETFKFAVPKEQLASLTLKNFIYNLSNYRSDINPTYTQITTHQHSKPLSNLEMLLSSYFSDNADIFLICDEPKPLFVAPLEEKRVYYDTLKKFSFFESGDWSVKINVDLPGVGKVDPSTITTRFLENSFEVKVHGLNNKNYLFSIPRASNNIDPEKSKIQVKDNSILIILRKAKKEDHWFSLHKQKMIGE